MSPHPEHSAGDAVVPAGAKELPLVAEVVETRLGMFGPNDGADTSGYGGLVTAVLEPVATPRPFGGYFDLVADRLDAVLRADGSSYDQAVAATAIVHDEMTIEVPREHLLRVMSALRDDAGLRFELALGASGVHFPAATGRELRVVYPLLSITHNRRIRVEVVIPDADPHLPSCIEIYPTLDWHERETWDFFGVIFDGHPALTRIMMPDDWPGHPQRKDYPLGGIPVEYKGAEIPPPDERRSYH
jgi:NADH-quinone oxidoreductase subunit C